MGIIKSQAAGQTIINYGATAVSAVAVLWIYTLELDAYNLAQFLVSVAQFLIPVLSLGGISLVVKYYPEKKSAEWKESYLFNMLVLTTGALLVISGLLLWLREPVFEMMRMLRFRVDFIEEYSLPMYLISVAFLYNTVLSQHASNHKRIIAPSVYVNLLPKLSLPVLIILLHRDTISTDTFVWSWLATYILAGVLLVLYLIRIHAFQIRPGIRQLSKSLLRKMASYGSYMSLSMFGSNLIARSDVIMIALLLGDKAFKAYFIAIFLARVVEIPASAIYQIAAPVISDSWYRNDRVNLQDVYRQAGLALSIVGGFIYFLLLAVLDPLFRLSADYSVLENAIGIFAILGLAKFVGGSFSANYHVIIYSKYYYVNLIFILISGVTNVALGFVLIQRYGIMGAAYSALISVVLLNVLNAAFIYIKFGMSPFQRRSLYVLLICGVSVLFIWYMPYIGQAVPDLLLRGVLFSALVVGLGHLLGLTKDFAFFFDAIRTRMRR